ncbi:HAMP domain-containing histidine kinase [Microbacterium sp. HD4P20]|uniref:sensor histidine kinase n=1 Tax=Microbacterium sp. HD4P20 TaxID=2864874 RepID=UPI0020A414C4|nr:HAMP domain-containing sensor histidine kinase [Microbacterium sp. HD4P20]MCP2637605.1 HAMP domain-containing histidine kinase [Microbacterium sp. HD4P20]
MLLAVGLFAAGIGTLAFLRNTLIENVDTQVDALARTDVTSPLLDLAFDDGKFTADPSDNAPSTDYFVAVYEPVEGELTATAGGRGGPEPAFPKVYPLDVAQSRELAVITLPSQDGETHFRATVTVQELGNTGSLYSQMVAVPLATVNRTVASYIGIYSILAILILLAGAVATRGLVTLTFRSLGQVESTADAIASGDLSQRMTDIEPTTTEVGRLKTAINAMLNHVDAAISQRDATVRQMRRFIGDASHELRTPLVTVRGYAELYRMGAVRGDDDVAQSMDRIEKEAIRMGLLVEDLLALARLDEKRDVILGPVDLRPIAKDAALDVRAASPMRPVAVIDTTDGAALPPLPIGTEEPEVKRRTGSTSAISRAGATLSLLRRRPKPLPAADANGVAADTLPSVLPGPKPVPETAPLEPVVLGDENRIRQIVTNLLGNARRFTADDSPIELRVGIDHRSRMGWIEVVDHGEGVPDQIKEKIFQRFWRADNSRTRETGGSGLGLSIVASIVEALHGAVDVFDTPGGGATFRVSFPLADARDAAEHVDLQTQPLARPRSEPISPD